MKFLILLKGLVLCVGIALIAGCTTTQPKLNAGTSDLSRSVRGVIGTSIIGSRGATQKDQNNIDDVVAGACAVKAFTESECEKHDKETQS